MTNCSLCGKEDLCFICPYCKGVFCGDHRLPEGHGCPAMQQVQDEAKRRVSDSVGGDEYKDNQTWSSVMPKRKKKPRRRSGKKRFSSTELKHLLIACILVTLVGISMLGSPYGIAYALSRFVWYMSSPYWWVPVGMILIFLLAFIGHELAHKFVAQHYGMWSEFRMTTMGYYLSAIAILFSVPIFGTGTVYTSGTSNTEHNGKINLAGPLSNFLMAIGLVIVTIFTYGLASQPMLYLIQYGIIINAILGLFNMIPIQPFDGASVKDWKKSVWITLTIALAAMLLIGYTVIPVLM
ncbi:MAG: hypothetical protein KAU48_02895 [Candidatus Thorarchaeota archaeon]|nr:hypothetical protein [Candidatus Thorarchaeota archaeon]